MQYDHLKFYSHGSSSSSAMQQPTSFMLGGVGVVPLLNGGTNIASRNGDIVHREKSAVEKHVEIVEYLKRLPETAWVGADLFMVNL